MALEFVGRAGFCHFKVRGEFYTQTLTDIDYSVMTNSEREQRLFNY